MRRPKWKKSEPMLGKHTLLIGVMVLALSGGFAAAAAPGGAPNLSNTMCPVERDEAVETEVWVDYEGQRVYLCCKRCRKKFIEDPSAYVANLPQFAAAVAVEPGEQDGHAHSEHGHDGMDEPDAAATDRDQRVGHDQPGAALPPEDSGHSEDVGLKAAQVAVGPEQGHDHETGHGQSEGPGRLVRFLGKFHPLAVHFPIALVLATLAAETLGVLTRQSLFSDAARFSIVLASLSALATAGLGWAAGASAHYPGDLAGTLGLHRWLGTGTGVLVVVTAILSEIARRQKGNKGTRVAYWVILVSASLGVGVTGHLGATLIYGFDYFTW